MGHRSFAGSLALAALLLGCDGGGVPVPTAPCPAGPGELVITEVLADPDGADTGLEWIEVYNASNHPIELAGVKLVLVHDGSEKRHTVKGDAPVLLEPGQYALLSSGPLESGQLYVYGESLGAFSNAGSILRLQCDDGTVLGEICWGDHCAPLAPVPGSGKSYGWNGASGVPNGAGASDPSSFAVLDPTPAAPNPAAEVPASLPDAKPEDCETVLTPLEADLTITEVYANPEGSDTGKEWFEFHVGAAGCVETLGMRATTDVAEPKGGSTFEKATGATLLQGPGHFLVAGPGAVLGGAKVTQFLTSPALGNTDGKLALWFDGQLVAEAHYGNAIDSTSSQWDGTTWCGSPKPSEDGTFHGSPGEANPPCGGCFCKDANGDVTSGTSPAPGELMVTEVFADAPGGETDNVLTEWFEVALLPTASGPRALACLKIGNKADASTKPIVNPDLSCHTLSPGETAVFGRSLDPLENGGIEVDVVYDASAFTSTGGVRIQRTDGVDVDVVLSYGSPTEGVARQLDPAVLAAGDPAGNDEASAWCPSQPEYAAVVPKDPDRKPEDPIPAAVSLKGTPGEANHPCSACVCKDTGGAFSYGSQPEPGEVMVTELLADVPGSESVGKPYEWFEVTLLPTVTGPRSFGCLAYGVKSTSTPKAIPNPASTCLVFQPGDRVLFGRTADPLLNGGLEVDVVYDGSEFTTEGGFVLARSDGVVLDQVVAYGKAKEGVSRQVSLAVVGEGDPVGNDAETAWCDGTTVYAATEGLLGTPGAANVSCP